MTVNWVIAGLGNPGKKYQRTRHNFGRQIVDAFAQEQKAEWKHENHLEADIALLSRGIQNILLFRPVIFMNESGRAMGKLCRHYLTPLKKLIVVYDDINLPVGRKKISVGGNSGGHNGVESIIKETGSEFIRYRLGIGPKHPVELDLSVFVLGRFNSEERIIVNKNSAEYLDGLQLLVDRGPALAMNQVNQRNNAL